MKTWYRIRNEADPKVAEIQIIDFIGDWIDDYFGMGVTAKQFVEELAGLPESVETIRVHINSPGGDVFGALNIANALRDQRATKGRRVVTIVDGLAASSASLVLMAGDPVLIADNGMVMVHNPWCVALGDATEMKKTAEILDELRNTIVATYQWHSELSDEELVALMDAETWMDADEAIAHGFATEKVEGLRAAASIDPRHVAKLGLKVPEKFRERFQALVTKPESEPVAAAEDSAPAAPNAVLALCKAAGLDIEFAAQLVEAKATLADAQQVVAAEKERRAAERARQDEIRAACKLVGLEDLAPELISGGMSAEQAKLHLVKVTAKLDKVEIDAGLGPDGGTRQKPVIDVRAIYAQRNQLRH